uniref:Potassium/proton antiporter CemA n=1 Tax=Trebouxia lynnae TaxID=1825957 RepID=A0A6B9VQA0_9CHLO|nr:envelope membrane protein [Trebouxia lynnae]QHO63927.1 envelope membrane protein [Trebouxia lynnae]
MEKRAFEQTGLVPRSIIRTFDRFRRQLLKGAETSVIQEFRVSRYQVLVSVKCLVTLIIIPLVVNFLAKTFFLMPLTEYLWNTQQNEIFLNLYQENRAFSELHDFEEKLFFESLIETQPASEKLSTRQDKEILASADFSENNSFFKNNTFLCPKGACLLPLWSKGAKGEESRSFKTEFSKQSQLTPSLSLNLIEDGQVGFSKSKTNFVKPPVCSQQFVSDFNAQPFYLENSLPQKFQQKTIELAIYYNQQSIEAITNLFGDFITFITISFLFIWMEPQIIILKSFLTESIYSLSDTTKSFLLILLTDLLVGFHSPRGWEIFLEIILRHFGLPENQNFIFLFVATFPVLLDTVFKYWIFRYLNQISPSTVATYHNMIE